MGLGTWGKQVGLQNVAVHRDGLAQGTLPARFWRAYSVHENHSAEKGLNDARVVLSPELPSIPAR